MKLKAFKWLPIALPALLLSGCGDKTASDSYSPEDIYALLSAFSEGYHAEGKLTQLNQYSGDYALNTFTETYTVNRDYGVLVKNGVSHDAISIHSGDKVYTYYRGDNGRITGDFYDYKNEVISQEISSSLSSPYFDNKYIDPFDFITYKDFDSELHLDTKKAAFIIEEYFGVTASVESASFSYDGSKLTADYVINDKTAAFEGDDDFVEFVIKSSLSLEISFDNVSFDELKPATGSNPALESALANNGDNYTLLLQSASSSTDVVYYVTETGVLELQDYASGALTVGDYYYKKDGDAYIQYMYNPGTVVTFEKVGAVDASEVLPDFASISPAIFESVTSDAYALVDAATTYVPYYLTPADYRLTEDSGQAASITLDPVDGLIDFIDLTFYYGGDYITYNQSILDRGTTVYPDFFDDSISDFI